MKTEENEKLIQTLGQDKENKKFIRWCIAAAIYIKVCYNKLKTF